MSAPDYAIGMLHSLICVMVQIVLCLRLDGSIGGDWATVMTPYYLYDIAQIAITVYMVQTSKPKVEDDDTDEIIWDKTEEHRQLKVASIQEIVYYIFRIIQVGDRPSFLLSP